MGCGSVVVATTEGSADGDTVHHVERFSLNDLERRLDAKRVWGGLAAMLQHILAETAAGEGAWTLSMRKARGQGAVVNVAFKRGWEKTCCEDDPACVTARAGEFFAVADKGGMQMEVSGEGVDAIIQDDACVDI